MLDSTVVYWQLAESTDVETRAKLREEIRRKVRRIDMRFLAGRQCVLRIQFANGAVREAVWTSEPQGDGWTEMRMRLLGAGKDPFVGLIEKTLAERSA